MKNKIFSLVLALALTLSGVNAMAATTDGIEVELKPENYATIYLAKSGTKKYTGNYYAWYNTLQGSTSMYALHMSLISSFDVPFKQALTNITANYTAQNGQLKSTQYMYLFYFFDEFAVNADPGEYNGPIDATDTTEAVEATETYTAIKEYALKHKWPSSSYTSKNLTANVAYKIDNTAPFTSKMVRTSLDITSNVLDDFVTTGENSSITLMTSRPTNSYVQARFRMQYETDIPTLTLTYSKSKLLEYVESSEDMATTIAELGEAGILDAEGVSNEGYAAFTALDATRQAEICTTIAQADFETFEGFITVYDSLLGPDYSSFKVYDITLTNGDTVYSDVASAVGQAVDVKAFTINEAPSGLVSILGAYDANGRLLTAEVANSNIEFSLTIPQGTSTIKLMCWNSIDDREPVCSALSK